MYDDCANQMADVIYADLKKPRQEAFVTEIEFMRNDLMNTIYNLKDWVKPDKVYDFLKINI